MSNYKGIVTSLPVDTYSKFGNSCCPNYIKTLGNNSGARCNIDIKSGNNIFFN